jgi:hypothetical protein
MVRASGNAPELGTDLVRIPLIRRTVLFELRAQKWRNAVDLHHLPKEGTHSLAPRPSSLVWLAFHWSAWQGLHLHCPGFEAGASALGYTRGRFCSIANGV